MLNYIPIFLSKNSDPPTFCMHKKSPLIPKLIYMILLKHISSARNHVIMALHYKALK